VKEIVYLDICCFKRPFDDATDERVREAEAVATILEATAQGLFELVRSPAHDIENDRNLREDRRLATDLWLKAATIRASAGAMSFERARSLVAVGFSSIDALHLAFSEQSAAKWFVTTDDRLLKRARAKRDELHVAVINPEQLRNSGRRII